MGGWIGHVGPRWRGLGQAVGHRPPLPCSSTRTSSPGRLASPCNCWNGLPRHTHADVPRHINLPPRAAPQTAREDLRVCMCPSQLQQKISNYPGLSADYILSQCCS